MYIGKLLNGVLICLIYVSLAGLFVVVWTDLKFFPLLPGTLIGCAGLLATALLAFRTARVAAQMGDSYILQPINRPLVYILAVLCFWVVPIVVAAQFTGERLWTLVWVQGDAMYPTLVEGDLLLVDRTAYRGGYPKAGDVVLLRPEQPNGSLRLARVVGVPGDEVAVNDTAPIVNDLLLDRAAVSRSAVPVRIAALDNVSLPEGQETYAERHRGAHYLISERSSGPGLFHEPVRLGAGEYFLLHDNRSDRDDSRSYGPIEMHDILGRPLYIAYSSGALDGPRWSRVAKRLQPGP
jgi:signal peptidase I